VSAPVLAKVVLEDIETVLCIQPCGNITDNCDIVAHRYTTQFARQRDLQRILISVHCLIADKYKLIVDQCDRCRIQPGTIDDVGICAIERQYDGLISLVRADQ